MAVTVTDVFDVQVQFPLDLRLVKPDVNGRDAIGTFQRFEGLAVWTVSEQKLWRLVGGISNTNWVDQTPAGGSGLQAVTVSSATPTGGNPGDIHFKVVAEGTEVWYNNAGSWGAVGLIPATFVAPEINNSLSLSETSSTLNLAYPTATAGFTVISKTAGIKYVKIDGTDWEQIGVIIV